MHLEEVGSEDAPSDDFSSNSGGNVQPACGCVHKIMVVDDNDLNLLALRSTIESRFKATVIEADNGKKALDLVTEGLAKPCKCESKIPKLIFMDI